MISTKGRYALRVMIDLAEQAPEAFIPLDAIAARQGISKKYLESILKILVQKKLLKGLRGKGGGYRLTRRAEEYTVGEILELTEGTLAPVACLEGEENRCERSDACAALDFWTGLYAAVNAYVDRCTLADLVRSELEKIQQSGQ